MNRLLLTLTLLISSLLPSTIALSCMDRSNSEVPWFTLIKYPGSLTSSSMRYAYLDPSLGDTYQIVYGSQIDTKGEALHNTFDAINSLSKKTGNVLAFNDEPPNSASKSNGAHAKGIIAFDNATQTGVYIMHSVPLFPNVTSSSGYIQEALPASATQYGQNGYCISIDQEIFNYLLANIPIEQPHVYYGSGVFESWETIYKDSQDSQDLDDSQASQVNSTMAQFNLLNGDEQWFFTKNPKYDGFLFDDIIGPYFDTNLAVESWGRPYQASSCPPSATYSTLNIDTIAFNTDDTWTHTHDHSKWAVTVDDNVKMACMCDMNRMTSQAKRGGSCLCTKNDNIYKALSGIVVSKDVCSSEKETPLEF